MKRYLTHFRALAFFEDLEDAQILLLAQHLTRRRLGTGDVLCEAGDPPGPSWVVARGGLAVFSPGGRRVAVLRAGEAFGLPALFSDEPRTLTARAVDETWLFEIDRAVFNADCAAEGLFGGLLVERVARLLAGQLRGIDAVLVRLESVIRPRTVQAPALSEPVPAALSRAVSSRPAPPLPTSPHRGKHPPAPRHAPRKEATDEELMDWIGELAERSGLPDLDSIKVVTSAEVPLRPQSFGVGRR